MKVQSQIRRTLGTSEALDWLAELLDREQFASRRALGRRVCAKFAFRDRLGRPQMASCLKALNVLAERSDRIVLPPPARAVARGGQPHLLAAGVALAAEVPPRLQQVRDLRVEPVTRRDDRRIWNTLVANEHRQGMTTFAGAQMRYLVSSAHGWLGALGFAAAALRLAPRERWIGWSDAQRQAHLERVVGLSRFLIRGGCRNLASHVLGRVLRRLAGDFAARYGYRPWLVETFVAEDETGASLRAANFVPVGRTAGRGRGDRDNRRAAGRKTVLMFALRRGWRTKLGVQRVEHAPRLEPGEGLASAGWAEQEFGGAELGDKRLTARLVRSAALLAENPGRAISAGGRRDAAVNGYYRLIEHPTKKGVNVKRILAPHRRRTVERMRAQKEVLCIQDGSDLRYATRPGCEGLEVIGRNQTTSKTKGLHLHLTLAVTGQGLPLGVLRCGFGTPPKARGGKSQRWIDGYRDIVKAARSLTRRTRLVAVMDREADFFGLFDEQRSRGRVEILVRARHNRVMGGARLFAFLAGGEADGRLQVPVEGLVARPKSSRKKRRPARKKRVADCDLRYRRVTLPATVKGRRPVSLWGVHIVEVGPPEGEKPVEWHLLTSLEVGSAEEAARVVERYLQRWRVEDFFRVLKSGCRVERMAFRSAERLQRGIAINSVIAWRLMALTLVGRQLPGCDADLMYTEQELEFLADWALERGHPGPEDLGAATRLVARLGGYRGRNQDPEPGHEIMWQGYSKLTTATLGHMVGSKWTQIRLAQK